MSAIVSRPDLERVHPRHKDSFHHPYQRYESNMVVLRASRALCSWNVHGNQSAVSLVQLLRDHESLDIFRSSGQTLASYQSSAKSASAATHPNEVQGGALSTSDGASRTTTMASGVTTSPSAASSHSPTSTGSGSSGPYGSSGSAKSAEVVASVGLFSFVMAATFYVVVLA